MLTPFATSKVASFTIDLYAALQVVFLQGEYSVSFNLTNMKIHKESMWLANELYKLS